MEDFFEGVRDEVLLVLERVLLGAAAFARLAADVAEDLEEGVVVRLEAVARAFEVLFNAEDFARLELRVVEVR